MANYRFRLETVRKLRESHRDELRGKLAEAYHASQLLEDQQTAVAEEITSLQQSQRLMTKEPTTSVNSLLEAQRYHAVLRAQQSTLEKQAKMLADEVDRRRQTVVEADQEVRILDKLDQRQRQNHHQLQNRVEAREMDEIASRCREENETWRV
jgi:flagellar export protein FliJ